MNLHIFAKSLTMAEVNELSIILWNIKKDYARDNCVAPNDHEINLAKSEGGYISAIKAYRIRTGFGLFESKIAIDSVR